MNAALCAADIEGFRGIDHAQARAVFRRCEAGLSRRHFAATNRARFVQSFRGVRATDRADDAARRRNPHAGGSADDRRNVFLSLRRPVRGAGAGRAAGCIKAREQERTLRILSAGCSSGEEAYSIAIVIQKMFPELANWNVSILGIDINPAAIEKATGARYSQWSLRETPDEVATQYFEAAGRQLRVRESIRKAVRFEQRSLIEDDNLFWQAGAFDIAFCRNVTIYFRSM